MYRSGNHYHHRTDLIIEPPLKISPTDNFPHSSPILSSTCGSMINCFIHFNDDDDMWSIVLNLENRPMLWLSENKITTTDDDDEYYNIPKYFIKQDSSSSRDYN
ncbi:hypothetical protein DERP_008939 [Dermatophagoides pteronyssinus]|uniref:Uncharacterized protein n=1 Tax=Dermatophagoides pteronyssinus TaxID=6956 RepID=A0ABQ8JP61_DERPT|nr:hypothetical protein DERP_008939 [Dermatophagoides pteronyssinus]